MTSNTRIIAHNTSFLLLGRVGSLLISLMILPVLARYLGPSLFGDYSLVLALNSIIIAVSEFGIQPVVVRESSKDTNLLSLYAKHTLFLRVTVSLVLAVFSSLLVLLTDYSDPVKLGVALVASSVVIQGVHAAYQLILQVRLKAYLIGLADFAARMVASFLTLVVIISAAYFAISPEEGLRFIFLGPLAGALIALVVFITATKDSFLKIPFDLALSKKIIKDAWPLGLVAILGIVHYRIDTVLLSFLRDSYEVGIYNLSYRFLDIALVFPSFLLASVYPILSSISDDPQRFRRVTQKAFDTLALAAFPVAVGLFVAAPQMISLVGGAQYLDSVVPLRILSLALIFSFLNAIFQYTVILKNKQKLILFISVVTVALNISINLILIPRFGYNGAAVGTVATEFIGMILMSALSFKLYRYSVGLSNLLRIILAGTLLFGILWIFNGYSLLVLIPLGAVSYLALILALKVVKLSELQEIVKLR